jgi:predicted nucleic acid-binding Zn ribbon protein
MPQRVGQILEEVLSERGYLTACREQQAARMWPEIVGRRVAEHSECTEAEGGILRVRVESAAWRQELIYLKHELLARIRKQCDSITDILFY